jgi:hypothetical protein
LSLGFGRGGKGQNQRRGSILEIIPLEGEVKGSFFEPIWSDVNVGSAKAKSIWTANGDWDLPEKAVLAALAIANMKQL